MREAANERPTERPSGSAGQAAGGDALLFGPDVARILGMSPDAFRAARPALEQQGFPEPLRLPTGTGGRSGRQRPHRRWWRSAVEDWKRRSAGQNPETTQERYRRQAQAAIEQLRNS